LAQELHAMNKSFPGFSRQLPTFFRNLEKNNARDWFAPRKELFETQIRAPMIELVTLLNHELRGFAVDHVADEPAKLIYRIYRDTRFSKDKTPYKTHIGATFSHRTLPRHGGAGYYFEVSHRAVGIAGGVYMPGPEELQAIRSAIAADSKSFLAVVKDPKITKLLGPLQGERLQRLPKPWQSQAASPAAGYLKYKQFYWYVELPAPLALKPRLFGTLIRHFRVMSRAMEWFNAAVLADRRRHEDAAKPQRPAPMW
jgi:uncharacterized protein (TIGR02453 family)